MITVFNHPVLLLEFFWDHPGLNMVLVSLKKVFLLNSRKQQLLMHSVTSMQYYLLERFGAWSTDKKDNCFGIFVELGSQETI